MRKPEEELDLESFGEPAWLTGSEAEAEADEFDTPAWLDAAPVSETPAAAPAAEDEMEDPFFLSSEAVADLATMENAVRRADHLETAPLPEAVEEPGWLLEAELPEEPAWAAEPVVAAPDAARAQQAEAALLSIVEQMDSQMRHADPRELDSDAEPRAEAAVTTQYVVFYLGSSRYTLPIEAVIEVSTAPRITTLPGIPHYVRGVTNLRGEILPVLDLRGLLGLPRTSSTVLERMLVVRFAEQDAVAGFMVDRVRGLAKLDATRIAHPRGLVEDATVRFLEGVTEHENEVLNVLSARKIFLSDEVRRLSQ